ncbi:hypothetical protein HAP41_0000039055 [Bradyrhizobium barranii subsp. apii]|jgi:hypothetical protein|uniref:Uncharacterized protein n=2 Tax=Bradyrhizobium TaxID=374 RepID=A0A8U0FH68_9BRAD|nr:hypothetical protein [Bradyrhizobium barranii]UPT86210.1 hypothetical protein HAP41_0000039055 [Bradyrhizobium barranii subsp. apii]UPT94920.1 hypothetical protein J4G48_0037620 [Bradyrhizobium barranii subsp. apii]
MIRLMARAQQPHWAQHPRQAYTSLMRGRRASFMTTDRTWWSLNTLQEQTIIAFS